MVIKFVTIDASVREGKSYHSICFYDEFKYFLYAKTFKGNFVKSGKAEKRSLLVAITHLLKEQENNNLSKKITLFTDCTENLKNYSKKVQEDCQKLSLTLKWISRSNNSLADKLCSKKSSLHLCTIKKLQKEHNAKIPIFDFLNDNFFIDKNIFLNKKMSKNIFITDHIRKNELLSKAEPIFKSYVKKNIVFNTGKFYNFCLKNKVDVPIDKIQYLVLRFIDDYFINNYVSHLFSEKCLVKKEIKLDNFSFKNKSELLLERKIRNKKRVLNKIKKPENLTVGSISKETLSISEINSMNHFFCDFFLKGKKELFDEVEMYSWIEKQPSINTRRGRKYAMKQFFIFKFGRNSLKYNFF